jgi:hypothetical protein
MRVTLRAMPGFQLSLGRLMVAMRLFSLSALSFAASRGRDVFFHSGVFFLSELALIGYVLAAQGIGLIMAVKWRKWVPMAFVAAVVIVAYRLGVIILTPARD